MKNLTKFFVAVATLFVGVSCATDPIEDHGQQVVGKGQTVITVSTGDDVRTSLGDKINGSYQVLWSEGDQLALHYKNSEEKWAVASSEALAAECEGRRAAEFTWEGEFAAPWCLAYPSSTAGCISFSATQSYTEDTFAPKTLPMYGYSEEADYKSVQLQHLAGVLRIGIYAEEATTVKKLYVENLDGSPIAGTFNCDFANGGALTPTERVFSTISYDASDVVLSQNEAEPTLFHIVVIPGKYETLRVTIVTDKGTMVAKVKAGENSAKGPIAAGQVREFKSVKFKTETANELEISNEATLEAFKAAVEGGNAQNIVARVTADFAVANWSEPIKGFAGVLDGGNHTISGLTAPLFDDLKGSVSNLNLNAAISVSDEECVGIVARSMSANAILCNCSTSGTLKFNGSAAVVKLGGLVATTEFGAQISECINNAAITLTGECSGYFGGITGYSQAYILDSKNNGAITFDAKATTSQQLYVGGIAGKNADLYIARCINNAAITLNGTINDSTTDKEFYVGGLIGHYCDNTDINNVSPRDCENTENGDITIGGTITLRACAIADGATAGNTLTQYNHQCWGGLFGRANQDQVLRSINRGDITVKATFTNESVDFSHLYISPWVGGIYGHGTVNVTDSENHGNITWTSNCKFNVLLGGVAGRTTGGTSNGKNYGAVKFDATTTGNLYIGGFCPLLVSSLNSGSAVENHGKIEFAEGASVAELHLAGIAGTALWFHTNGEIANGLVSAKNYGQLVVNGTTTSIAYIGGMTGHARAKTFTKCENLVDSAVNGSGSIVVGSTATLGGACYIGGILGRQESGGGGAKPTNSTNAGDITFNGKASDVLYIGGVLGGAPVSNARPAYLYNTGNLTIGATAEITGALHLGGVCGGHGSSGALHLDNSGCDYIDADAKTKPQIKVEGTLKAQSYVGGVVGLTTNKDGAELTNLHNNADIIFSDKGTVTAHRISGILAHYNGKNLTISNCTNRGDITCNKSVQYLAGVLAYDANTITLIDGCNNHGNITASANATITNLGGVIGYASAAITTLTNCTNTGDICCYKTANYLGGIMGRAQGAISTISELHNSGDITNTTGGSYLGGIGVFGSTSKITNSSSVCNICATIANVGMFNGYAATASRKVSNSKIGGTIQRQGDAKPVTINEDNFSSYIFNATNDPAGFYENITVVILPTEE